MVDELTKALGIGTTVLLVSIVALVGIITVPALAGGANSFVVLSESMEPALAPGDVVVVRSVPPSAIEEGDVVTYRATDPVGDAGRDRLTHRVVEKRQTESSVVYRTRGDANDRPDPALVSHEQVVGTVWFHVPLVGHLVLFAQRPLGLAVLVVGPGLLLLGDGVERLLGAVRSDESAD
jgi:signal peptidase